MLYTTIYFTSFTLCSLGFPKVRNTSYGPNNKGSLVEGPKQTLKLIETPIYHIAFTILYYIVYTIYHTPYTVYNTPYTIHRILYTIYHTPYTIYHTPYTVYYIPYTKLRRSCGFPGCWPRAALGRRQGLATTLGMAQRQVLPNKGRTHKYIYIYTHA